MLTQFLLQQFSSDAHTPSCLLTARIWKPILPIWRGEAGAEEIDTNKLLPPERHQVVFAPYIEGGTLPDEEAVKRIIYWLVPPDRPDFLTVRPPSGLNEAGP